MAPRLDRMAVVFIDHAFTKEATCDPKLVTEALQFRIAHQMMGPKAFYLNITVWKLVNKDGTVEYLKAVNDSEESQAQKVLDKRVEEEMAANPKANRKKLTQQIKEHLDEYYVYSGVHSEPKVADDISHRSDVRKGLARVTQVYTEREPCADCQGLMNHQLPALKPVPFFYFLSDNRANRRLALEPYGKSYQLLMLNRYGV
jgi:ribosomal protein S6